MSLIALPYTVAMRDPLIAAADYTDPSWRAWWVIHSALDAEPPPVAEVPDWEAIWTEIAGGRPWPTVRPREPWIFGSRRIAKTREMARRGAWACITFDPVRLSRGERAVYAFSGPDRAQSQIAYEYAAAFVEGSPILSAMIEDRTKTELRFTNRTAQRVMTASFRTQRGWTLLGAHNDEAAYMFDGDASANPFAAILDAQRPAMGTVATAQLSVATTPRGRNDTCWQVFSRFYGRNDPRVLVLRVPWFIGNPTLDSGMIQAALEEDEPVARAEYFGEFRADVETFLSREVVSACVIEHRGNLPPQAGAKVYWFTDPAGGTGGDSYTLSGAMKNKDGRVVIVHTVERKPPFSPDDVTEEFAGIIKSYGSTAVCGDRFAGEWPRERFRKNGVTYNVSERTKTQIYQDALPLLTGQRIELPDNARLISQLCALERRTARGGRDSIDHPPRGHDDLSNAVLGAALGVTIPQRGGGEGTKVLGVCASSEVVMSAPSASDRRLLPPVVPTFRWPSRYELPQHKRRSRG